MKNQIGKLVKEFKIQCPQVEFRHPDIKHHNNSIRINRMNFPYLLNTQSTSQSSAQHLDQCFLLRPIQMRVSSETKSISRRVWGGKNKHQDLRFNVNEAAAWTGVMMSRAKEMNLNEFSEVKLFCNKLVTQCVLCHTRRLWCQHQYSQNLTLQAMSSSSYSWCCFLLMFLSMKIKLDKKREWVVGVIVATRTLFV